MKAITRLSILFAAYLSIVLISSCCDNSDAALNGRINTVVLQDYDVMPEAINNDVIRTGFILDYFPATDLVFMDFKPIGEVYGQDGCTSSIINALEISSVGISFSKDVQIGGSTISAGSNLLASSQFSSVEITDACDTRTSCEFTVAFPTPLVQNMNVESGPLTITLTARTNDGVNYNHPFDTMIDLL